MYVRFGRDQLRTLKKKNMTQFGMTRVVSDYLVVTCEATQAAIIQLMEII